MKRTLALRKDTLTELTADDLHQVAGGDATAMSCTCLFCPTNLTRCGVCDLEQPA